MSSRVEQEKTEETHKIAIKEVDGYIERVEKQAESSSQQMGLQPAPQVSSAPDPILDDSGDVLMEPVGDREPEIVLPLTKSDVSLGLSASLFNALRWLAEVCVYLIKKYPGRVFYPSQNVSGDETEK